jgi:hypothetical protein
VRVQPRSEHGGKNKEADEEAHGSDQAVGGGAVDGDFFTLDSFSAQ